MKENKGNKSFTDKVKLEKHKKALVKEFEEIKSMQSAVELAFKSRNKDWD